MRMKVYPAKTSKKFNRLARISIMNKYCFDYYILFFSVFFSTALDFYGLI